MAVGRAGRSRARTAPVGTVTRGTTNPNRLRRMDRWIAAACGPALRRSDGPPVVVDLGFGAAPWTAVELADRLRRTVRPDTEVVGVEIDPSRVAAARAAVGGMPGVRFLRGGFEAPTGEGGRRPVVIRAANVLRQYGEDEVAAAWELMRGRLAPDGLLVEGTCDEIGRRHAWVALGPEGPRTLTLATRLGGLTRPSDLAERLPKALIHRNIPGEPVHRFLHDLDRAWAASAAYTPYGAAYRWRETLRSASADWPLRDVRQGIREGTVTVDWSAVAPS